MICYLQKVLQLFLFIILSFIAELIISAKFCKLKSRNEIDIVVSTLKLLIVLKLIWTF